MGLPLTTPSPYDNVGLGTQNGMYWTGSQWAPIPNIIGVSIPIGSTPLSVVCASGSTWYHLGIGKLYTPTALADAISLLQTTLFMITGVDCTTAISTGQSLSFRIVAGKGATPANGDADNPANEILSSSVMSVTQVEAIGTSNTPSLATVGGAETGALTDILWWDIEIQVSLADTVTFNGTGILGLLLMLPGVTD